MAAVSSRSGCATRSREWKRSLKSVRRAGEEKVRESVLQLPCNQRALGGLVGGVRQAPLV